MGKEVDFEALASQYIWEHLKKLNIGTLPLMRWRSTDLQNPTKTVLFTISFTRMQEKIREETSLPVAILTEDGILRFLIGSGTIDLKQHRPSISMHFKG